jgi:sulfoxide reductase heme-binding subunit YedZ
VLVGCFLPAVYMTTQWCLGLFTSRPLNQAMLMTGVWAVWFLLLSLAVSPARSIFGLPKLIQVRRMLGLAAAAYTVAHLVFYGAMEGFNLPFVVSEILHRFYLTQKIDVTLAVLPTGLFLWLMLWRGMPAAVERTLTALLLLAIVAGAGTVAVEYAWYALATFVPASRVLAANWHWGARGPRPSFWVTLDGLAVVAAALLWRVAPKARFGLALR